MRKSTWVMAFFKRAGCPLRCKPYSSSASVTLEITTWPTGTWVRRVRKTASRKLRGGRATFYQQVFIRVVGDDVEQALSVGRFAGQHHIPCDRVMANKNF